MRHPGTFLYEAKDAWRAVKRQSEPTVVAGEWAGILAWADIATKNTPVSRSPRNRGSKSVSMTFESYKGAAHCSLLEHIQIRQHLLCYRTGGTPA